MTSSVSPMVNTSSIALPPGPQNTSPSLDDQQPKQGNSQEPTRDAPEQNDDKMQALLNKYGKRLIDLSNTTQGKWDWKRRAVISKVLKNKEMLKGNQYMGMGPSGYDTFDAMEEYSNFTGQSNQKNGDRSMDTRPHNFYQMVEKAFVSGIGSMLPKTRTFPANAEVEEDRETAKVASRVQEIIEDRNKSKSLLKQELMELWTSGCYFKFTRYVIDAARTGTHKETIWQNQSAEILPSRYICFECGKSTPEDEMVSTKKLRCPNCGAPMSQENFFQDHSEPIPVANEQEEVANGMVLWDVYGPLHVNVDPDASDLTGTPLLNLAMEVPLGWLRTAFPKMWAKFEEGQTSGSTTEALERQYRDMLTTPSGYNYWFATTNQYKPTYNRLWAQPMMFAELGTEAEAKELTDAFPEGCMLAYVAEIPLQIRPAKLTNEWTWCGSEQKGFGLNPNPIGDPAVPVQERLNDCIGKIDEYMDRLACGILLALEAYIDTKAMNGKAMLPGILNPVAMRKGASPATIQEMIFQVRGEIDAAIFTYVSMLKQDLQLLVGTPPQTFGGGTQDGVETLGGQQLQFDAGMNKMGLAWQFVCEEHAEAAENAIRCAAKNMTEDWFNVVSDRTNEFQNEYIHLDQMKGSVHVKSDTEQGFPMSYADQKAFWSQVVDNAESAWAQILLGVPENVDAVLRFCAPPGTKAPLGAMQGKMLRIIDQLMRGPAPAVIPDPITGEPLQVPCVLPNKYLDDLATLIKLIPQWSDEHWDKLEGNQNALDNLVGYYKMCVVYQKELEAEKQLTGGAPPPPCQQPNQSPQMSA